MFAIRMLALFKELKIVRTIFLTLSIFLTTFQLKAQTNEFDGNLYRKFFSEAGDLIEIRNYYKTGTLKQVVPFQNDQIHGKTKYYKKNGRLKYLNNYINGKLEGEQYWYLKRSTYIETYDNGIKNKIFHVIQYNRDGSIKEEYYNKFFEGYGPYKLYYANGNPMIEGQFNGIKRTGVWSFYNKDGSLKKRKEYDNKFVFSFRHHVI